MVGSPETPSYRRFWPVGPLGPGARSPATVEQFAAQMTQAVRAAVGAKSSAPIDQVCNAFNAQVLGISVDPPFSLKAWAEKEGISIPLLSDFNKEVSAAYGAQYSDFLGFKGVAKRSAFVLDGEGKIRYASVSEDAAVLPDFEAKRGCLKSLN